MNCYRCKNVLKEEYKSEEHLIPNSIGGHTISKNLLCKNCNSILGKLDAGLAKQLNVFMVLLNPNRDHGKIPPISAKNLRENEEVYLNANKTVIRKHPKYAQNEDGSITITASRKKRMNQELNKIKKKDPSVKIEKPVFSKKKTYSKFHSSSEVPIEIIKKGLLKISINHFLEFGGNHQFIESSITKLESKEICDNVFIYPTNDCFDVGLGDIQFHFVNIIGNADSGLIYGHVALFNFYRGTILLSDQYKGQPIGISKYHPLFGDIQDSDKMFVLDLKEIKQIFNKIDS
jgi:hypothetical protein